MSKIIYISGGCRSGKSDYAESTACNISPKKLYLATCPVFDPEMKQRVERHKQNRADDGWDTVEEEINIAQVIRNSKDYDVVLVDCLTLWLNNLIYSAKKNQNLITEGDIVRLCEEIIQACRRAGNTIIFVSNEIGMGIVPESESVRLFRDLCGICNQEIAKASDEAVCVISGLPLHLKKPLA